MDWRNRQFNTTQSVRSAEIIVFNEIQASARKDPTKLRRNIKMLKRLWLSNVQRSLTQKC
jgi:hypothetical protein